MQIKSAYDAAFAGGPEVEDVHPLDYFFSAWFALEILLRMMASKSPIYFFWYDEGWEWNCFDSLIAVEAVAGLIARLSDFALSSQLRVLGIFRLARLVAPMKKVKELWKLRKTLLALAASMVDLFWAFLVVMLFLYVYSIFLSTATVSYFEKFNRTSMEYLESDQPDQLIEVQKVHDYYGSVGYTMLSLWSAISGGNDWMEYAETLKTMAGNTYYASFIAFTAFCTIGLFNVVTGIFVDSAVEAANMFRSDAEMVADHQDEVEKEEDERKELEKLLDSHAGDDSKVDEKELANHLTKPKAQAFWKSKMQLNTEQVKDMYILYQRLQPKQTKDGVSVRDFLHFARKCKGQASYVDLLTLMHDHTRLGKDIHVQFQEMKQDMKQLVMTMPPLPPPPTSPPPLSPRI
eukprot:symbB.v1.2.022681.t1/scaffold2025.1/size93651/4